MDNKQPQNRDAESAEIAALAPPVDVLEDQTGITVIADLPGVGKDDLFIRVEGDTLLLEGQLRIGEQQDLDAVYAEVRVARYRRSFVLSRDLDTSRIDAVIKNGVLRLRMPKSEQAKPRRIEVRVE